MLNYIEEAQFRNLLEEFFEKKIHKIVHISSTHIYNSELKEFDISDVENFLADRA